MAIGSTAALGFRSVGRRSKWGPDGHLTPRVADADGDTGHRGVLWQPSSQGVATNATDVRFAAGSNACRVVALQSRGFPLLQGPSAGARSNPTAMFRLFRSSSDAHVHGVPSWACRL